MPANSLDAEIQKFLPYLGTEEKKSILGVIKSFLQLKNDVHINIEQYNAEIDEALSQVNEGDFLTNEELKKKRSGW